MWWLGEDEGQRWETGWDESWKAGLVGTYRTERSRACNNLTDILLPDTMPHVLNAQISKIYPGPFAQR